MALISIDTASLLAIMKFRDDLAVFFGNTRKGAWLLDVFGAMNREGRILAAEALINFIEDSGEVSIDDAFIASSSTLPPALPGGGAIIALQGFEKRYGGYGDAPALDSDGFPEDIIKALAR